MLAVALHQEALNIADGIGAPYLTCESSMGLAAAHHAGDRLTEATALAQEALTLARHNRFRVLQGQANLLLARCMASQELGKQARDYALRALDDHLMTGHRLGAAHAHVVLGELLGDADPVAGKEHAEAAQALHTEILGDR
ncbi:hypothetical protein [Nonomuraea sp. NPDC005692]|uniref:hypothetical protein n=1 Tax=Nonomuraea sp. NPDC005692 TaxID=3157168 RepID=UPI0033CEA264